MAEGALPKGFEKPSDSGSQGGSRNLHYVVIAGKTKCKNSMMPQ